MLCHCPRSALGVSISREGVSARWIELFFQLWANFGLLSSSSQAKYRQSNVLRENFIPGAPTIFESSVVLMCRYVSKFQKIEVLTDLDRREIKVFQPIFRNPAKVFRGFLVPAAGWRESTSTFIQRSSRAARQYRPISQRLIFQCARRL